MERCFVIQPFDGGVFDDRYEDVLAPAIRAAGMEPYRIDRDPGVVIPIQQIETEIRNSRLCLADITIDNPNVWFELGFAIASYKDVVLVCSNERTKFPFDVQHRHIIKYKFGAPRDFDTLKRQIKARIEALLQKEDTITSAASNMERLQKIQGLEPFEVVALAAIGANIRSIGGAASGDDIRSDMERAGFNNLAANMALKSLADRRYVAQVFLEDEGGYKFPAYELTNGGWTWMNENRGEFVLKQKRPARAQEEDWSADDIPF